MRYVCYLKVFSFVQGKVDAGEVVSDTVLREFGEEALSTKEISEEEKATILKYLQEFFQNGDEVNNIFSIMCLYYLCHVGCHSNRHSIPLSEINYNMVLFFLASFFWALNNLFQIFQ